MRSRKLSAARSVAFAGKSCLSLFIRPTFRAPLLAVVPVAVLSALTLSSAQAQTYKGDAYGAKIAINAPLVGVGAIIVDNPNLPSTGSAPLTGQLLNANVQADAGTVLVPNLFTVLTANTINTSTQGAANVATSISQIEGLTVEPGFNINLAGLGGLNLASLVQADVITSTTTATLGSNTGRTQIANLRFGAQSLGNVDVSSAVSTTYYLNLLGSVSATASGSALVPDVAQLVINDQSLTDNGATRTTNALVVRVLPNNLLTAGAGRVGDITVASSTAGFTSSVTAAPEPGSAAFFGMAAFPLAGLALRRYRQQR